MHVTIDARILCRRATDRATIFHQERTGTAVVRPEGTVRQAGHVTVVGLVGLCSYDQYGTAEHTKQSNRKDFVANSINAVVVTTWAGTPYAAGHEPVLLTSLPVTAPLAVLDLYDLRSLIENTAFRELKQGWCLLNYPTKTAAAVRGHVLLTVLTFTLANAFQTRQGQWLTQLGIRRQRAEVDCGKVIVVAGEDYGIFDIEEVMILLGVVPKTCLRTDPDEIRRRYGLPATDARPTAA
jgi:hypothetical protein